MDQKSAVARLRRIAADLGEVITELEAPPVLEPEPEPPLPEPEPEPARGYMATRGRALFDGRDRPVLIRGAEGWFGPNAQRERTRFLDAIAATGANAVRLQLPGKLPLRDGKLQEMSVADIESLIRECYARGFFYYMNVDNMPGAGGQAWFGRAPVREMLQRPDIRRGMIIDATVELGGDVAADKSVVARWLAEQKEVITRFRSWGYKAPLLIGTPNAGRYLRGLLDHGPELVAHDPEHSLVLACQMYWGQGYDSGWCYEWVNGYVKGDQGVEQAFRDIAKTPVCIQLGFDAFDSGGDWKPMPLDLQMRLADECNVGALFWEWKDPDASNPNDMTRDALDPHALTDVGHKVVPWLQRAKRAAI